MERFMPFWIAEGNESGTCAGATIKAAMHTFSDDLYRGCEHFAKLAEAFDSEPDIRMANTSCIFFGVSCIEARLNEKISTSSAISQMDTPPEDDFWINLEKKHIRSPLQDKWNLVAKKRTGTEWNNGSEPFQSYNLVVALRNELVHYKGAMYGKDETPNKRIKHLMNTLGLKSESSFTDDDCSSWVHDLLNSPKLGVWVYSSISAFWGQFFTLIGNDY